MDESNIRLLEKLWGDLRHIETERHWFLGAYAVIVVGVLALADDLALLKTFGGLPFLVLAVAGLLGLLHSVRAAWVLLVVQDKINDAVEELKKGAPLQVADVIDRWRFDQGFPRVSGGKVRWLLSVLLPIKPRGPFGSRLPTFVNIHTWLYVLAIVSIALLVWFSIDPDVIIPPKP